eukprot:scaffold2252_cov150-Amphora_coffeaeformis.AAC.2
MRRPPKPLRIINYYCSVPIASKPALCHVYVRLVSWGKGVPGVHFNGGGNDFRSAVWTVSPAGFHPLKHAFFVKDVITRSDISTVSFVKFTQTYRAHESVTRDGFHVVGVVMMMIWSLVICRSVFL